jgi:hypothetical protein
MSDAFPLCSAWATNDEARLCSGFDDIDDDGLFGLTSLLQASTYLLYLLSGKRYPGICEDFVRPPAQCEADRCCLDSCACCHHGVSKLTLGAYPIREIIEVEIDGETLDESEYQILNRRYLLRMADVDGNRQKWPGIQRLDLPFGDPGTWGVRFFYGQEPPRPGAMAMIAHARELGKACAGDATCKLPARVQSVARQGVTMVIGDPQAFMVAGLTGLGEADGWLAAERYAARNRRPAFVNPDFILCGEKGISRLSGDVFQS